MATSHIKKKGPTTAPVGSGFVVTPRETPPSSFAAVSPSYGYKKTARGATWISIPAADAQAKITGRITEMREQVQVPADQCTMKWSSTCADAAKAAAIECRTRGTLVSSNCENMGQCLSFRTIRSGSLISASPELDDESWSASLTQWYDERRNYANQSFDKNPGTVGNFTQLTWFDTQDVGLAIAYELEDDMLKVFVIANFAPPGNINNPEIFKSKTPHPDIVGATHNGPAPVAPASGVEPQGFKFTWTSTLSPESRAKVLKELADVRKKCKVPAKNVELEWNDTLAQNAANAAVGCRKAEKLVNSNHENQGQCLSFRMQQSSKPVNPKTDDSQTLDDNFAIAAIGLWYEERKAFNQTPPDPSSPTEKACGNFTQLVWFDTKEVGVGIAYESHGGNLKSYVVFNFSPPGNVASTAVYKANTPDVGVSRLGSLRR